jgi:hypothetical protein
VWHAFSTVDGGLDAEGYGFALLCALSFRCVLLRAALFAALLLTQSAQVHW